MKYTEFGAEEVKIAYVGGGSRGWAWGLMSDLATAADMSGEVCLYDIDYEAAKNNEIIGNRGVICVKTVLCDSAQRLNNIAVAACFFKDFSAQCDLGRFAFFYTAAG